MHVVVLGSGVIGLMSAWYLREAGYQVSVIDRQPESGNETSFANAGQISYGYSSPWAAPGVPSKALKWLFEEHAPLKITPSPDKKLIKWAGKMLLNCQIDRYRVNKARMLALANHSQACLQSLKQKVKLDYQGRELGTLQVFRHQAQLKAVEKDMRLLEESGTRFQLLSQSECIQQEPGLASVEDKLVGGLFLPDDETGDCHLFCQQMTKRAKDNGIEFYFDTHINGLITEKDQVVAVSTDQGQIKGDAFVVAMGSYSTKLLEQLNIKIPVYPVKGYSLTIPIQDEAHCPTSTIMDESYKVALTRFDDRIRVAGMAELNGFDPTLPKKRLATLEHVVADLFPKGVDLSRADYWTGFRPMTPDGTPLIGATPYFNLYTNTGHGTLGWTMACGSGDMLAKIVSHQLPDHFQQDAYNLYRYD
ncbi:D-amino acid dehydrogenase [Vibrio sonorensis]|uniref:D-amino acid dehydrogenase n=1 Tax=Vibrio sonorensis TaxID=1004316 RepID=UPI0008DAB71A|nr:D-amino acid dehydrogenase [Vibrio sonorensis]